MISSHRSRQSFVTIAVLLALVGLARSVVAQTPPRPVISAVVWKSSGQYRAVGTGPAGASIEIRNASNNQLVGNGHCDSNGRFDISCNPVYANADDTIQAVATSGHSNVFTVPPNDSHQAPVPDDGLAAGPGARMSFFDITYADPAVLHGMGVRLAPGTWDLHVYTTVNGGSKLGRETSPTAWTDLGGGPVVSFGPEALTFLPVPLAVSLTPNVARGFCVAAMGGTPIQTVGTPPLHPLPAEPSGVLTAGGLSQGFFTTPTATGIFRGSLTLLGAPAPGPWQRNRTAWLDIDGVQSNGLAPAIAGPSSGSVTTSSGPGVVYLSVTNPGELFDLAFNFAALVPFPSAGALSTGGGQRVNLDLLAPTYFLNSGSGTPNLQPFPGLTAIQLGAATQSIVLPSVISAQMIVLDPASVDGFTLTQAIEYAH